MKIPMEELLQFIDETRTAAKTGGKELTLIVATLDIMEAKVRTLHLKETRIIELLDQVVHGKGVQSDGCPMCDYGKLRNPEKEHWSDCAWYNAQNLLKHYGYEGLQKL